MKCFMPQQTSPQALYVSIAIGLSNSILNYSIFGIHYLFNMELQIDEETLCYIRRNYPRICQVIDPL